MCLCTAFLLPWIHVYRLHWELTERQKVKRETYCWYYQMRKQPWCINENFFTNENLTIKLTKTILQNVHEIVEVLKFHNNRTHNSTLALSWMIDYSPCKFWSPMTILNYQIYTYDTQRWPKSFGSWNSTKTGYMTTPSPSLEWLTPHLACFGDQWCQLVSFVL